MTPVRFSSIFQMPLTPRAAAVPQAPARVEEPLVPIAVAAAPPDSELPEALDERVRLVGEWQLGDC
ncbi:MAG: hypothetical protein ACO1PB_01355 [Ramlibacter sp.]